MGFKYINEVATQENTNELLTFIDLVAGAPIDANNVFDISDKLRDSKFSWYSNPKIREAIGLETSVGV